MNTSLQTLFYKNAAWNTLDALGSQTLVVIHHILLHIYAGAELHGMIGTAFSLLYMVVLIANMGFDFSCAPFMQYYTAGKAQWLFFIRTALIPQLYWLLVVMGIGIVTLITLKMPVPLALVFALTFLCESIKKSFKLLLQLLFYTRLTALTESIGMVLYMAGVWGLYQAGYGLSVFNSFAVLGVVSCGQACTLGYGLYRWYRTAPETLTDERPADLGKRVAASRIWVSLQRIIEQVFSNNFLTPFFAVSCGLGYASYFKIISSIARWVSLFGDKTFGTTSLMVLTHSPALRLVTMQFINRLLRITVFITCPLIILISNYIGYYYCSVSSYDFILMCSALIVLRFVDMMCVVYERWLLVEEKMFYVLLLSLTIASGASIGITYYTLSPLQVVLFLMLARSIQAILCSWYMNRRRYSSGQNS